MAKRELRFYGDETLKKPCRPVTEVSDHVRLLLDDMADTLASLPGCTVLAANQLGLLRRLLVLDTGAGIVKLVNPVITEQCGQRDCQETCSSIKNVSGTTVRPQKITVEALDEFGNPHALTFDNDLALALCHGIDHLDGKLLIEKVIKYDNGPLEGEE